MTSLAVRNLGVNLVYYALTAAVLPWLILLGESWAGVGRARSAALGVLAAIWFGAGGALQFWSIRLLYGRGGGTPSPLWPPHRLVVCGPYRWLRNPINAGEVIVLLALAMWFGSRALAVYALLAALAFHAFIVRYEEPHLMRRFGDSYRAYREEVGRWWPRQRRTGGKGNPGSI